MLQQVIQGPWPTIVVAAMIAVACGGEGTGTPPRQPVTTAAPEPTATERPEPSVGTRLSAASADNGVQFEMIVTSESTFDLRSVAVKIDAERSCGSGGFQQKQLVKAKLSPPEVGTISDGRLEFRGSQAISIASQDLDSDLITIVSTLEGSEGLTIKGRFTDAKRAEGVLRFAGGPVLTLSLLPAGGESAEDASLTCDTGEIAWTARSTATATDPCEPGDVYDPQNAWCADVDEDSGVQCPGTFVPFREPPSEDYVCFEGEASAGETIAGPCEPGDLYEPPDPEGDAACFDLDGDSGVQCEGNYIAFRQLPSLEYVCEWSPPPPPGAIASACTPGENVEHNSTIYRCVEEGSLQDGQPCSPSGQHYLMPSGQTFVCTTTGPFLPP